MYLFTFIQLTPLYGYGDWGQKYQDDFLKVTQPQNMKSKSLYLPTLEPQEFIP